MSTGWKWIRDDGEEFKNQRRAVLSLADRPESRFIFSELSMAGVKETDVTREMQAAYAAILARSEDS